jgi:hypothetical protein
VTVFRAQGNVKAAVESLHEILKLYQSDTTSWMELADIHLSLCDYQVNSPHLHWTYCSVLMKCLQSAAYCFEELVLLAPLNSLMHTRLAETLYTIGTPCYHLPACLPACLLQYNVMWRNVTCAGGMEALVKARKHYSLSLANQTYKTNTRALYGMVMTCRALVRFPSKK